MMKKKKRKKFQVKVISILSTEHWFILMKRQNKKQEISLDLRNQMKKLSQRVKKRRLRCQLLFNSKALLYEIKK